MADHSTIEWTDATWNPITGCSVLSPGCTNCYAMKLAGTRLRNHPSRIGLTTKTKAGPVWNGTVRFNEQWLTQPLDWRKPKMVFVCAHGDLFHEDVPDEWIDRVFAVMALSPQHTFQVLTKRAERMRNYMATARDRIVTVTSDGNENVSVHTKTAYHSTTHLGGKVSWPVPNVWLGVSAEDQRRADERVPHLLATPAAVRFVSAEPLLGPIDLCNVGSATTESARLGIDALRGNSGRPGRVVARGCWPHLDWIIVGGESGPRPMHPDWARSLRDQCDGAGTSFFFKQWGSWQPRQWRADGGTHAMHRDAPDYGCLQRIQSHPDSIERTSVGDGWQAFAHVGKKAAGRLLDGIEHNAMPETRS
ncbi:MAG: phage Gp37/Gp68 family protein [Xanthobacteraceae bacterium]